MMIDRSCLFLDLFCVLYQVAEFRVPRRYCIIQLTSNKGLVLYDIINMSVPNDLKILFTVQKIA